MRTHHQCCKAELNIKLSHRRNIAAGMALEIEKQRARAAKPHCTHIARHRAIEIHRTKMPL